METNYVIIGSILLFLVLVLYYSLRRKRERFENYVFTSFAGYDSHIVIMKLPILPSQLTVEGRERIYTKNLKKDLFVTVSGEEWILLDREFSISDLRAGNEVILIDDVTRLYYLASFDKMDNNNPIYSFPGKYDSPTHKFSYCGKVICKNSLRNSQSYDFPSLY